MQEDVLILDAELELTNIVHENFRSLEMREAVTQLILTLPLFLVHGSMTDSIVTHE